MPIKKSQSPQPGLPGGGEPTKRSMAALIKTTVACSPCRAKHIKCEYLEVGPCFACEKKKVDCDLCPTYEAELAQGNNPTEQHNAYNNQLHFPPPRWNQPRGFQASPGGQAGSFQNATPGWNVNHPSAHEFPPNINHPQPAPEFVHSAPAARGSTNLPHPNHSGGLHPGYGVNNNMVSPYPTRAPILVVPSQQRRDESPRRTPSAQGSSHQHADRSHLGAPNGTGSYPTSHSWPSNTNP